MADVQWIKIKVGMFDGESFKRIKKAKIGGESFRDKLTSIWFELMEFAGRCNHSGAFINNREIPYKTIDDIAIMIDREPDELALCMNWFINEGMVEIIDDVYLLSNWCEYQNEAGLDKIREQKRIAQAKWRAKKKAALVESTVDSTQHLLSISTSDSDSVSGSLKEDKGSGEKEKKQKHKYGQYNNVLLTDEELEKLKAEFPSDWNERIERLSEGIEIKGYKYKSHLAVIRKWAKSDKTEVKKEETHDVRKDGFHGWHAHNSLDDEFDDSYVPERLRAKYRADLLAGEKSRNSES